jgi:hypothetical protein
LDGKINYPCARNAGTRVRVGVVPFILTLALYGSEIVSLTRRQHCPRGEEFWALDSVRRTRAEAETVWTMVKGGGEITPYREQIYYSSAVER